MNKLIQEFNYIGKHKIPSFFVIDYKKEKYHIFDLNDLDSDNIMFSIEDKSNVNIDNKPITYDIYKQFVSFEKYKIKFDIVQNNIKEGNTYLLNLTQPTKLEPTKKLDLKRIFHNNSAKFKLYFSDDNIEFVCFSPEEFISIKNNIIYTYPMKGTIEVDKDLYNVKDLENKLLNDPKELAEHTMIVDLLRNDLAQIATNVKVDKFRFFQRVKAHDKQLIQTSSKISAILDNNWQNRLGDILDKLLPAGSITGTPKISTMKIIEEVEGYDRGYFTGIFGYFDGKNFQSAVMIRYIENKKQEYIYKSGGGITLDSDINLEYQEMIDKVYF